MVSIYPSSKHFLNPPPILCFLTRLALLVIGQRWFVVGQIAKESIIVPRPFV
jgi:hypothetical protein